jgi:hypothetical protein
VFASNTGILSIENQSIMSIPVITTSSNSKCNYAKAVLPRSKIQIPVNQACDMTVHIGDGNQDFMQEQISWVLDPNKGIYPASYKTLNCNQSVCNGVPDRFNPNLFSVQVSIKLPSSTSPF